MNWNDGDPRWHWQEWDEDANPSTYWADTAAPPPYNTDDPPGVAATSWPRWATWGSAYTTPRMQAGRRPAAGDVREYVKSNTIQVTTTIGQPVQVDFVAQAILTAIDHDDDSATVPETALLFQNYPNPFNPETVIRYQLSAASYVRLTVYDLLGRQVKRLTETRQPAGSYAQTWDGTDDSGKKVVSGVYLYRIAAGPFTRTMKMLLMK